RGRAGLVGERGVPPRQRARQGQVPDRQPERQHPGRAAGGGRRQERRQARHAPGRRGLPQVPLQRRGAGAGRQESLPSAHRGHRGQARRRFRQDHAVHDRQGVRGLGEGAGDALRGRRNLRSDLPARIVMTIVFGDPERVPIPPRDGLRRAEPGSAQAIAPRARSRGSLPGFGLSLGMTLTFLSLVVLIPLSGLVWKTASLDAGALAKAVLAPRALAAYRLSFGAALVAGTVNVVFGVLIAWVLTRYEFPGRGLVDAAVDLPFALPTAVAGIALTTLYVPDGWLGRFVEPHGIKIAFAPAGVAVAMVFVGLPFVVRTVQPVLLDLDLHMEEVAATL